MITPDVQSVVEELRSAYIRSLAHKLQALHTAAAARNFKEVLRHGHQLKGSGRSYGFPEVSDIGARIEEAGLGHLGTVLDSLLVELEREVQQLLQGSPSLSQP